MINFLKTKYPALVLYFVSATLTCIGYILKLDYVVFLTKPIVVPSIVYYYLQLVNLKVDWLFLLAIILSFTSDMFVLIDSEINLIVVFLNLIINLIFVSFFLKDFIEIKNKKKKIPEFALILLGFLVLLFVVLDLIQDEEKFVFYVYTFYGLTLAFLSTLAVFLNLNKQSYKTFNGMLMILCFMIGDIFYVLYNYQFGQQVFLTINLMAQVFSYYYMIGYISNTNEASEK